MLVRVILFQIICNWDEKIILWSINDENCSIKNGILEGKNRMYSFDLKHLNLCNMIYNLFATWLLRSWHNVLNENIIEAYWSVSEILLSTELLLGDHWNLIFVRLFLVLILQPLSIIIYWWENICKINHFAINYNALVSSKSIVW